LVTIERRGIDVVLAVDCSSSMNAEDVKPSRLAVAKRELGQLATELDGNRLGLVGFAGTAFSFCPLTLDVSATQLFLDQLDTNAMPVPGTSLGDAIHTSMQSFPAGDPNKKVILLLTDGEDHHSDPLGAAKDAARAGIVIDTVGIGNSNGEPIPETLENGQSGFVRDASGQVVMSRLDEASLKQIAKLTGGIYTHVDGTQADALAPVVAAIGGTERHRLQETVQRRHVERFQVLLLAAIVLLGLERWMTTRRSLKGQL
jgi:Ca-activated chloride channel family protein